MYAAPKKSQHGENMQKKQFIGNLRRLEYASQLQQPNICTSCAPNKEGFISLGIPGLALGTCRKVSIVHNSFFIFAGFISEP